MRTAVVLCSLALVFAVAFVQDVSAGAIVSGPCLPPSICKKEYLLRAEAAAVAALDDAAIDDATFGVMLSQTADIPAPITREFAAPCIPLELCFADLQDEQ